MPGILLGPERNNNEQTDLPSPQRAHTVPGLHVERGALQNQGPGEEFQWSYESQGECFQREDNKVIIIMMPGKKLQGDQIKELRGAHLAIRRSLATLCRAISLDYWVADRELGKARIDDSFKRYGCGRAR